MNQARLHRDNIKSGQDNVKTQLPSHSDNRYSAPSGLNVPELPPRKPRYALPPSYHSPNHAGRFTSVSSPDFGLDKSKPSQHLYGHKPVHTGSYSDVNGKNIGKYNCRSISSNLQADINNGRFDSRLPLPAYGLVADRWGSAGFDPHSETASEGGSSTSGSYLVDTVDLGAAEMSSDVFV
jgi:hypothetical protein